MAKSTRKRAPTPEPTSNAGADGNGRMNGDGPYVNGDGQQRFSFSPTQLDLVINTMLMTRAQLAGRMTDQRRDYNAECGYPATSSVDAKAYKELYERNEIAARVVEVMPRESWQGQPEIVEDEDTEDMTPFEQAFQELNKSLRGQSWFEGEEGAPVWEHLRRIDELSGIGHYGVVLLGLDDGLELSLPAEGVVEENSQPVEYAEDGKTAKKLPSELVGNGVYRIKSTLTLNEIKDITNLGDPGEYGGVPIEDDGNETVEPDESDREVKTGRKLLFLKEFDESLAQIVQWESNPTSPRYGQPVMYNVTFNDPVDNVSGGAGMPSSTQMVHWTRIVHVADNVRSNEIAGTPRMRPVLNRLLDLGNKLYGGSAEMYWRGAFPGTALSTVPQLGGDVEVNEASIKDMMENYSNGLQRYMVLKGMQAQQLAPSISDPTPQITLQIEAICIQIACPIRVFKGSERGELASSQDDSAWNDRLRDRQNMYVTPCLIVKFVDRLIMLGVLPEPKQGYKVLWPDLTSLSDNEKADIALKRTQAIGAYIQGGLQNLVDPLDYLTVVVGLPYDQALGILRKTLKALEKEASDDDGMGLPSDVVDAEEADEAPFGAEDDQLDDEDLEPSEDDTPFSRAVKNALKHVKTKKTVIEETEEDDGESNEIAEDSTAGALGDGGGPVGEEDETAAGVGGVAVDEEGNEIDPLTGEPKPPAKDPDDMTPEEVNRAIVERLEGASQAAQQQAMPGQPGGPPQLDEEGNPIPPEEMEDAEADPSKPGRSPIPPQFQKGKKPFGKPVGNANPEGCNQHSGPGCGAHQAAVMAAIDKTVAGAARGELASIRDLRKATEDKLTREEFDTAVMELARQEVLSLHRHDYPAKLTQDQRNEMLHYQPENPTSDQERRWGVYFVGAAVRQKS